MTGSAPQSHDCNRNAPALPGIRSTVLFDVCCWLPAPYEKKCQERATHYHEAYGEVCPTHAARLMAAGENVVRLLKHRTGLKSAETIRAKSSNVEAER